MCERCDAWEKVIGNWFGERLLAKLETFVEENVEKQPEVTLKQSSLN
jgi:hypothetical protein